MCVVLMLFCLLIHHRIFYDTLKVKANYPTAIFSFSILKITVQYIPDLYGKATLNYLCREHSHVDLQKRT